MNCYTGLTLWPAILKKSPRAEMAPVNCPSEGNKSFLFEGVSGWFILTSVVINISEIRPLY